MFKVKTYKIKFVLLYLKQSLKHYLICLFFLLLKHTIIKINVNSITIRSTTTDTTIYITVYIKLSDVSGVGWTERNISCTEWTEFDGICARWTEFDGICARWTELDRIGMCKDEYCVMIDVDIISDETSINITKKVLCLLLKNTEYAQINNICNTTK